MDDGFCDPIDSVCEEWTFFETIPNAINYGAVFNRIKEVALGADGAEAAVSAVLCYTNYRCSNNCQPDPFTAEMKCIREMGGPSIPFPVLDYSLWEPCIGLP
jgi:hypothetical protein